MTHWPHARHVIDRLIARGRAGVLDAKEQAFLAEKAEEYRAAALRLEATVHRMTK